MRKLHIFKLKFLMMALALLLKLATALILSMLLTQKSYPD